MKGSNRLLLHDKQGPVKKALFFLQVTVVDVQVPSMHIFQEGWLSILVGPKYRLRYASIPSFLFDHSGRGHSVS